MRERRFKAPPRYRRFLMRERRFKAPRTTTLYRRLRKETPKASLGACLLWFRGKRRFGFLLSEASYRRVVLATLALWVNHPSLGENETSSLPVTNDAYTNSKPAS
uniref:Uncharacterized protein n=1 Tax=Picea glauca TaxID=3330 RepID=A0A101M4P8_PICGL|nr:hypothetical protein ABT39_MTgene769 [Picea glauca]QHR90488.1 hypothetical protein Q903MT_gene4512 [Picea sitchensis]